MELKLIFMIVGGVCIIIAVVIILWLRHIMDD